MSYMVPLKTKPEPDADARIALAACVVNDTVYVGWRHSAIMVEQLMPRGLVMTQHCQGFVDQHGFFWDREMSARIALAAKQTSVCHGVLVSEALWDMDGTPRSPSGPYDPLGDTKRLLSVTAPLPKPSDEGDLRRLWIEAGGSFHGPNVEHGTMPEAKLLPFLGALVRERDDWKAIYRQTKDGAQTTLDARTAERDAAIHERDIAKASAQGACDDLTQQMARSDELAMKLAAAEKRAEAIQQYASDDRTLAQTYKRERDAAANQLTNIVTAVAGCLHTEPTEEDRKAFTPVGQVLVMIGRVLRRDAETRMHLEDKAARACKERDEALTVTGAPPAPSDEVARLRAVLDWFAGDDTGISSEAIARIAVGLPPSDGSRAPSDAGDRGRCVRLLRLFPWMLPALATLESAGGEWRTQGKLIREGFLTAVTASKEKPR